MTEKIVERIENYKKHRQEWVDKQNNYQWTMKERDLGSESYGMYQEKEQIFTIKILELEWVLGIFAEKDLKT